MNIIEDYNLKENADIVVLAQECAKSLDSTELKKWFEKKYSNHFEPLPSDDQLNSVWENWCQLINSDPKNLKVRAAFFMGAKLALSNSGWKNHKL